MVEQNLDAEYDLVEGRGGEGDYKEVLRRETHSVERTDCGLDLVVGVLFVCLPKGLSLRELEIHVICIVMSRMSMVPLLEILIEYIDHHLEGNDA